MLLTSEQKAHVERIISKFTNMLAKKYAKGVQEHGGNLWDYSELALLDEAINETLDQFVYLTTLRERIVNRDPR